MNQLDALFAFNTQALNVRAYRGQLLASNIANSDTPGYQARDIDFAKALTQAMENPKALAALTVSSPRHVQPQGGAPGAAPLLYRGASQPSIDGNTVDLDVERAQFADNAVHFEANLMAINGQIKTMMAALQG